MPLLVGRGDRRGDRRLACRPTQLQPYLGGGLLSILLMMAVGIPLYVCATASVPIAAGLIHMGASPGAALAFLIAGPATNAATITTIWKLLGRRTALLYLLTIAVSAVGCGLLLDWLIRGHCRSRCRTWPCTSTARCSAGSRTPGPSLLLAVLAFSYLSRRPAKETQGVEA